MRKESAFWNRAFRTLLDTFSDEELLDSVDVSFEEIIEVWLSRRWRPRSIASLPCAPDAFIGESWSRSNSEEDGDGSSEEHDLGSEIFDYPLEYLEDLEVEKMVKNYTLEWSSVREVNLNFFSEEKGQQKQQLQRHDHGQLTELLSVARSQVLKYCTGILVFVG